MTESAVAHDERTDLENVVAYLCVNYPVPDDLSNARLTKLVYLADWETAKRTRSHTMTEIKWRFNHYGPWVPDVVAIAHDPGKPFYVEERTTALGSRKTVIGALDQARLMAERVSADARAVLDTVIKHTNTMYFGQFIDYVYGTAPIAKSDRYETLDLVGLARLTEDGPLPDMARVSLSSEDDDDQMAVKMTGQEQAQLLASVHRGAVKLLGSRVPTPAATHIAEVIENATIESVELSSEMYTEQSLLTGGSFRVRVDAQCDVEGFKLHENTVPGLYGAKIDIIARDWTEKYAWVSVPLAVRLTLEASRDAAGVYHCDVVAAEVASGHEDEAPSSAAF